MAFYHICNPENRRAEYLRAACENLNMASPVEIPWLDFLNNKTLPYLQPDDLVRIESPGENFEVERLLIEKGGGPANLTADHGRLRHQVEWYAGWVKTLQEIPSANYINAPDDIALMFDKFAAQKHLQTCGVPIPELIGKIESFDHLISRLEATGNRRVFLKPCHSSSASGVIAFQMATPDRILATTSAELIDDSLIYNSLRLRQYRDVARVRQLIDLLAHENLMAEKWFPKASFAGKTYDLRVLVIAGTARHIVARTSSSPITNLHLGNARGDIDKIRADLGAETWSAAMQTCESAAAAFPKCHYIAVDLMISSSRNRFAVAEVNAFGDLIPNILSDGDDTYTAELRSIA